ncbi:hypothetical protein [Photorhabdus sp. SF281]|uniref:hypothetical protein n=1 Tax=Photorhabdus sp. SF281 TaxID=3459527 RepID=UPI0040446B25
MKQSHCERHGRADETYPRDSRQIIFTEYTTLKPLMISASEPDKSAYLPVLPRLQHILCLQQGLTDTGDLQSFFSVVLQRV